MSLQSIDLDSIDLYQVQFYITCHNLLTCDNICDNNIKDDFIFFMVTFLDKFFRT